MAPHDLLWPSSPTGLRSVYGALPDWVNFAWPAVVRRAPAGPGWLPVGLRGDSRSLRHAAHLATDSIARSVTPESLTHAWRAHPELLVFNSVVLLKLLCSTMQELGLVWGPTGSTGFALATGYPVLRCDSDLDLVVRAEQPLTVQQVAVLSGLYCQGPCRVDVQIDTGLGAFAYSEWQRSPRKVLFKTVSGPRLTEDPWGRAS